MKPEAREQVESRGPRAARPLVQAEPGPARPDVERLWYEIIVRELGVDHPAADHAARRLPDAMATDGHLLVAREPDGALLGTCLVSRASEVDLGYYHALCGIRPGDPDVSLTTKLMIAPRARRSRLGLTLAAEAFAHARRVGIRTDFADCQPSRLPLFTRLGYRRLPGVMVHPVYGSSIPLRLDVDDLAHLEACGSPLLRVVRRLERAG